MSKISAIRTFFKDCPVINPVGPIRVDNLISKDSNYSISPLPTDQLIQEYVCGDKLKEYQFALLLRSNSETVNNSINNQEIFEDLSDWLDDKNNASEFPDFGIDNPVQKLEAITSGYQSSKEGSGSSAAYQITCRIEYRQKGALNG